MSDSRPERSIIFDVFVDAVFRTALLFSVFLLFTGHNAPGGGFVGGLVVGAALVLRYNAAGEESVRQVAPISPQTLLGVGITIAALTAAGGWLGGGDVLEGSKWNVDVPVIGTLHVTSALFFDIGVYLVVVGLALGILRTLGAEEPS